MKKILIGAAVALSLAAPAAAPAQRNAGAQILIVDTERVFTDCNACRAATQQLQAQRQQLEQRAQQLGLARTQPNQPTALEVEEQQIQTALQAARGNPDAVLQQRMQGFQTRLQQATGELERQQQTLRSTQAHVQQQIGTRLVPIIEAIRNARGASVVMSRNATLAHNPALDVTNDVLAQLNQQLPSVAVTPLPQQQQQPAQPQGR
ncbi:MAG: OmpH family outer membrane protein [Pseudomonadota bacterium]|nr:OmpH family outer membrane protein [Pseudomonadota bacterium]